MDAAEAQRAFDPRDPTQKLNRPETWKPTRNPALLYAHEASRKHTLSQLYWSEVAKYANLCDLPGETP